MGSPRNRCASNSAFLPGRAATAASAAPLPYLTAFTVSPRPIMIDYLNRQAAAARQGRFTKFVPASGGATRMFELLLHYYYHVDTDLKTAVDK